MRNPRAVAIVCSLAAMAACNTTPLGPVTSEEVVITLHTTGGIAGIDRRTTIDGAEGVVRVSCVGVSCTGIDGPLPVSEAQVSGLAGALEDAGIIGLDGTDFGTACCDMFHGELTYERDFRRSRVQGTMSLFPRELQAAIQWIGALEHGRVPVIVSPDSRPADWPSDALMLEGSEVEPGEITLDLSYSGGCGLHSIDLVLWGGFLESFPIQVNAHVSHEDRDDACDAIVREDRTFDLEPLRVAYEEAYGPIGGDRPTVILRITAPGSTASLDVEVTL